MECLIGGAFLALIVLGFLAWLGGIIQSKQMEGQPGRAGYEYVDYPAPAPRSRAQPAPRRPADYDRPARVVESTPRQQRQAAQVRASERAVTSARRQALKGTPRGTVAYERIRPVSYEGKTVNAICLDDKGNVTGYVDLADMPLDWE